MVIIKTKKKDQGSKIYTFIVDSQMKKEHNKEYLSLSPKHLRRSYNIMETLHRKINTNEHDIIWFQTDVWGIGSKRCCFIQHRQIQRDFNVCRPKWKNWSKTRRQGCGLIWGPQTTMTRRTKSINLLKERACEALNISKKIFEKS